MSSITGTTSRENQSTVSLEHWDIIVEDLHGHDQSAIHQGSNDDVVQIQKGDIVIAVLGPPGSGKSEFINTMAGRKVAPTGTSLYSYTKEVRAYKCKHPVNDRYVILVDTPGLDDSDRTNFTVLDDVTKWLHKTYMQNILLSGILQLHSISENRMCSPQMRVFEALRELCGSNVKSNLVMLTTFWDLVDVSIATAREAELIDKFWGTYLDFFNDRAFVRRLQPRTQACAWEIIDLFKTGACLTIPKPLPTKGNKLKSFYDGSASRYWTWTNIVDSTLGTMQSHTHSSMEEKAKDEAENSVGAIPKNQRTEHETAGDRNTAPQPSSEIVGVKEANQLYPVAEAPSQVSMISLSNSSSSAITDYYSAHDDGTDDATSTLSKLVSSANTPLAKPGPMLGLFFFEKELSSTSSIRTLTSADTDYYTAYDDSTSTVSTLTESISFKTSSFARWPDSTLRHRRG